MKIIKISFSDEDKKEIKRINEKMHEGIKGFGAAKAAFQKATEHMHDFSRACSNLKVKGLLD